MSNSLAKHQIDKALAFTLISFFFIGVVALSLPLPAVAFVNKAGVSSNFISSDFSKNITLSKKESRESNLVDSVARKHDAKVWKLVSQKMDSNDRMLKSDFAQAPLETAAQSVQADNQSQLLKRAKEAFDGKNYLQAFRIYSELAEQNNAEAQASKGEMLWYGDGIASDPVEAKIWLSKAAMQGNARASAFMDLFAEREKRQKELDFYTTYFDGALLKWNKQTCEAVLNELENAVREDEQEVGKKTLAVIDCYNLYTESIRASLKEVAYIPTELNRLMREEEVEKSKQLARTVLFQQAMLARAHVVSRLAAIEKQYDALETSKRHQHLRDLHRFIRDAARPLHRDDVIIEGRQPTLPPTNLAPAKSMSNTG